MLKLDLHQRGASPHRILCLGAHADDIEIGAGGTILSLLKDHSNADVHWVVFSSDQQRAAEARESASLFLREAGSTNIVVNHFKNSFFPYIGLEIKEYFEQIKQQFNPDVILTHYRHDLHQDHRVISELTWNAFRDHLILEYEIPKYDGDFGSPNMFVHLDEPIVRKKLAYIVDSFESQKEKDWFDEETFLAVLRLRGMESRSPSKYAEAFYCRKTILS